MAIYDFILELYRTCSGDWDALIEPGVTGEDLHDFLTYAATFLSNVGNYFVRHKFFARSRSMLIYAGLRRPEVRAYCGC